MPRKNIGENLSCPASGVAYLDLDAACLIVELVQPNRIIKHPIK
jgi:hypothetical protein